MKTKSLILMAAILFSAVVLSAEDLILANGTTYKDVKITQTTLIGLQFISEGKAGWVDFRDLTAEEAQEYGYDPQKAEAFEQQIAQNNGNMVQPQDIPPSDTPDAANLDPQTVPQTPENTQTIDPNQQQNVVYEPQYYPNDAPVYTNGWVNWGGRYYPSYWWHNWYWGNHWVNHNGRYYPYQYYHHHGTWYNGKYYPYHHGLLKENQCKETKPHNTNYHQHPKYTPGAHTNYNRPATERHSTPHETPHAAPHGGGGGGRR